MVYCKYCGMESKTSSICEWCGRALIPVGPTPSAPPHVRTTQDVLEEQDEADRKARTSFYISCGVLILLSDILVAWRFSLFPVAILGSLLVTGFLLGKFGIVMPFEDEWWEFGTPLILLLFFPTILVYAGYMTYGLITRQMDMEVVWVLSAYCGMHVALILSFMLVIALFGPHTVPRDTILKLHLAGGFVGLLALGIGWISSGAFNPSRR